MAEPLEELIRRALESRLSELCNERIARLSPSEFGSYGEVVSRLQAQVQDAANTRLAADALKPLSNWAEWDGDCLKALSRLTLGEPLQTRTVSAPPAEPFTAALHEARREPERRFHLLAERYSCPLNITLDSELYVREHLLERLMVQDRAKLERGEAVNARDVLLKLNLLSVYAAGAGDLRYLDVLNYYHELRPAEWKLEGRSPLLLIFYLGLYARALSAWLNRKLSE